MKEFETHDVTDLFRIGVLFAPPCLVILSAAWISLYAKDVISAQALGWLLVLNVPITLAGVALIFLVVRTTSVGVAHMVTAAGKNSPPPPHPPQGMLPCPGEN